MTRTAPLVLGLLGFLAAPAYAEQEVQHLDLRQAVELGLRTDPGVASALATSRRSQVGVLRAQLDRFSLRVDASLSEEYRADNLFKIAGPDTCGALVPIKPLLGGSLFVPATLTDALGNPPTSAQCGATAGTQFISGNTGVQSTGIGVFNVQANLQVPIFSGFRVTSNVQNAQHTRDAAVFSVKQEQRRLALDVLRTYWAVRRAEMQQAVSRSAIDRYNDSVQVVGARVRAGLVPPVDQNRMETQRQRELARLADLEGAAAEARAQLSVLLGLPNGVALDLTEAAEVPGAPPADPAQVDHLLDDAGRIRPDLRAARAQVLAGKDLVRFQLGNYYPQLSGVALLQVGNNLFNPLAGFRTVNDTANPFANINGSAFVGGSLSVNLFDTLNTYTAVRAARYDVQRLQAEEQRTWRLVEADVRTAHAHLVRLYQTRDPLLRTRDLARDSLEIIEKRYKSGDALVLDYLQAQLDLLNAEIDLANSAAAIVQGWGELQIATGRMPGGRV